MAIFAPGKLSGTLGALDDSTPGHVESKRRRQNPPEKLLKVTFLLFVRWLMFEQQKLQPLALQHLGAFLKDVHDARVNTPVPFWGWITKRLMPIIFIWILVD